MSYEDRKSNLDAISREARIERLEKALRRIASQLDEESYREGCMERMLGDVARKALEEE